MPKPIRKRRFYIANTTKEGSEERRKQSENAKAHYDEQVKTVNDSYAEIVSAVTNAYFEQNVQNSEFYAALQQYNADVEAENQRFDQELLDIREKFAGDWSGMSITIAVERENHQKSWTKSIKKWLIALMKTRRKLWVPSPRW